MSLNEAVGFCRQPSRRATAQPKNYKDRGPKIGDGSSSSEEDEASGEEDDGSDGADGSEGDEGEAEAMEEGSDLEGDEGGDDIIDDSDGEAFQPVGMPKKKKNAVRGKRAAPEPAAGAHPRRQRRKVRFWGECVCVWGGGVWVWVGGGGRVASGCNGVFLVDLV